MKSVLSLIIIILTAFSLKAQNDQTWVKGSVYPYAIEIGFNQTTNLIFPFTIKSVDRGNSEVLVQKAKGVENVLQLKAGIIDFTSTNLTVITGEGSLYSFQLHYHPNPVELNYIVAERSVPVEQSIIFSDESNEAVLKNTAKKVSVRKKFMRKPGDHAFATRLELQGIYIAANTLYFQLWLENNSNIKYDVDQFRLFIKDKKITKRTASQEIELTPLYIEGNVSSIDGASGQVVVVAVDKFTISDNKHLHLQLMERNGGRHLKIRLGNKHLVKAKSI